VVWKDDYVSGHFATGRTFPWRRESLLVQPCKHPRRPSSSVGLLLLLGVLRAAASAAPAHAAGTPDVLGTSKSDHQGKGQYRDKSISFPLSLSRATSVDRLLSRAAQLRKARWARRGSTVRTQVRQGSRIALRPRGSDDRACRAPLRSPLRSACPIWLTACANGPLGLANRP